MSFRLVPKSVTLNDLERRNNPYFALLANVNVLRYVCYMLSAVRLSSVCLSVVCDVGAPYSGG